MELAHRSAQVIVQWLEERERELERLFYSAAPPLRQHAALSLSYLADEPLVSLMTTELRSMAMDAELPAWVRGKAIRELGSSLERAQNRTILVELLERQNWFFGAQGAHFKIHSLALVINALSPLADDPVIARRLGELYPALADLRTGEREYVEWKLDNALGRDRPIFGGPVVPEIDPD